MLPVVGIIAVGLLFVAGKFFFSPGFRSNRPSLPLDVTALPRAPREEKRASAEENNAIQQQPVSVQNNFSPAMSPNVPSNIASDVPFNMSSGMSSNREIAAMSPAAGVAEEQRTSQGDELRLASPVRETVVVVPSSVPRPTTPPTSQREPIRPKQTRSAPPSQRALQTAVSQNSGWRVQLGAFATQAAAERLSREVTTKVGYSPFIISNANKTLHRVLIRSGTTREEANRLAAKMIQAGFRDAFVVSPQL